MAAATTSDNQTLADHKRKIEAALRNVTDEVVSVYGAGVPFCYAYKATIPTTSLDDAGDIRRLIKFPPGAYITDFRGTPTDSDTNATPTLQYDVVVIDSEDTVKDTLVSNSTNGQAAAGSDRIASAAVGQFVGDRWLAIKIDTGAATPAAMTYRFFVSYAVGILSSAQQPSMTDVDA